MQCVRNPAARVSFPRLAARGRWRVDLWQWALLAGCGLLVLAMTRPAFGTYFFGEDFGWVAHFRNNGDNFWRALVTPFGPFYRPMLMAVELLWWAITPLDSFLYHARNFVATLVVFWLLYRVLVRLVAAPAARALGLIFFAASKVHLTTIGWAGVFDSIVTLALILATVLCFLRYVAERRRRDYALGLVFATLAAFTRDYGVVIAALVVVLLACYGTDWGRGRAALRGLVVQSVPLLALAVGYVIVRQAVVGAAPSQGPYAPQLALDVTLQKLLMLTSVMGNLSFGDPGTSGASGLGAGLAGALGSPLVPAPRIEIGLYGALLLVLAGTLWAARARWRAWLFPLAWIALYFGPTLLTRNAQMYYLYEPLAGAAVLLAVCLDGARARWLRTWTVALVLIALSGAMSNHASAYHWQTTANAAQQIQRPVIEAHRGEPLESITFVTNQRNWWASVLSGPMVPELLGLPHLQLRMADYADLPAYQALANERNLVFDVDNGWVAPGDQPTPSLVLHAVHPSSTRAGEGFGVQAKGEAALSLDTENARPGVEVVFDDTPLTTSYGNEGWVTALVPAALYREPGRYEVYLRLGARESNRVDFVVEP